MLIAATMMMGPTAGVFGIYSNTIMQACAGLPTGPSWQRNHLRAFASLLAFGLLSWALMQSGQAL